MSTYIITSPATVSGPSSSEVLFNSGGNIITFKPPDTLSNTYNFVLPPNIGTQDQILTLNSSLETEWTTSNSIFSEIVEDTTTYTNTNAFDLLIPGMTITPPAGTYYCIFTADIDNDIEFQIYEGINNITESSRSNILDSDESVGTIAIATVNGTEAIEVRAFTGSSYTVYERSLFINRVN